MTLKQWIENNDKSQAAFAKRVGVTPHGMSYYVNGVRKPKVQIILKIYELTDGCVDFDDWYADEKSEIKRRLALSQS